MGQEYWLEVWGGSTWNNLKDAINQLDFYRFLSKMEVNSSALFYSKLEGCGRGEGA